MNAYRAFVSMLLATLFSLAALLSAAAQNYPTRVIRLIVPYPAGGPTDVVARIVADRMAQILRQSMIVENRPGGAAGTVGSRLVAKEADPDGYTLLISIAGSLTITPSLYKLDYDPLKDLTPIGIVAESPEILTVNPAVPAKTLAQFLAYAQSNPGKLNLASPGVGTLPHVLGELLQLVGHIKMNHVPYRGAAPAIIDLLAGRVQAMFNNPSVVLAHIQAGRLLAPAVTSDKRLAQIPDVPTFAEAGYPQLTATEWLGLLAPAGTPEPIIEKLNAALNGGLQAADAQASLQKLGLDTKAVSPHEFKAFLAAETRKWAQVVAQAGIKGE
jgi:tripartite-type tricarboxylate transporter receptor subunit TctC